MPCPMSIRSFGALLAGMIFYAPSLWAQDAGGCVRTDAVDGPARQIFTCSDTVTFEREPNATLRIIEAPDGPVPRMIEVQGGAILIEVAPGSAAPRIRTPHAIAAVRGTIYVVDAGTDETSIFVVRGTVQVQSVDDADPVTLIAGDGVDVSPQTPLAVQSWSDDRAAALLARFGR